VIDRTSNVRLRMAAGTALSLVIAAGAGAQQFQEETAARFNPSNLTEYTNQASFADIDGDGDLDLAFANGGGFTSEGPPQQLRLYINDGAGNFTDEGVARTGGLTGNIRDVQFGDVDGDGDLDFFAFQDFNKIQFLYLNDGTGNFTNANAQIPTDTLAVPHGALGDVDGDGDLDCALANGTTTRFGNGVTQLWLNDGSGVFTDATATNMPNVIVGEPMDVNLFDIDNDFDLDMLVGSRESSFNPNDTKLFRNDGNGVFTDITAGNWPGDGSCYSFDIADYDNDGDLDALGVNTGGGSRESVYQNDGTGSFTDVSAVALPIAQNPSGDDNDSKFFDFTYDGNFDLIVGTLFNPVEKIWTGDGTTFTLFPNQITPNTNSTMDVEVADVDCDGDIDIITGQGESGNFTNRIYINTGDAKDSLAPRFPAVEQVADTDDTTGPYVVRARIRDDNSGDTGPWLSNVRVNYNVDGGGAQLAQATWVGYDMYRAEIPGLANGGTVVYHVQATDKNGNTAQSDDLSFTVTGGCDVSADCNGDGSLNILDFTCFQALFSSGSLDADCNGDGSLNILDFTCFQAAFSEGCI